MIPLLNKKSLSTLLLAVVLGIGSLVAQEMAPADSIKSKLYEETGPSVEAGLRYLPLISTFKLRQSDGSALNTTYVPGFGFAAYMGYNFSSHAGFQGEMMYSSHTRKYTQLNEVRTLTVTYVSVPLLFTLNTGRYRVVNVSATAGPQFGINAGNTIKTIKTSGEVQSFPAEVINVKGGDFGLAYGAGIDFGLGAAHTTRLGMGVRGVVGLADISGSRMHPNTYYIVDNTNLNSYAAYIVLSHIIK